MTQSPDPRSARLSEIRAELVLGLHGSVQTHRRALSGRAARPDHGRRAVAAGLAIQARQLQHRRTEIRRPRLGRHGDDRRHAEPAAGLLPPDRACHEHGKPVVVGGPDATSSPHLYESADFQVLGEAEDVIKDFVAAWERGERSRRVHRREIHSRRHQDADPALRPAQVRPISLHLHPVLARLPVHLRVLRHHRAVRPQAAHQDQRADAGGARAALRARLSRPCRLRRRQPDRQQEVAASTFLPAAQRMAGSARLPVRILDRSLDQPRRRRRAAGHARRGQLLAVFVGIESPDPETLVAMRKKQNTRRNLAECVHKIYSYGMSSPPDSSSASTPRRTSIGDSMAAFIDDCAIPVAWSACSTRCRTRS